jgi:nondiscriminating glutamyl-tRNA synthetase
MSIRTRFAPSPTGYLHIGGVRTALFNWLLAKRHGGQWILRIDDTDAERNRPEALQPILDGFRWLGMQWDEGPEVGGPCGPYYQSQKLERYKEMAYKLVATGHAYPDLSSKEELDVARKAAEKAKQAYVHRGPNRDAPPAESLGILTEKPLPIRMKVPLGKTIAIDDLIRGHVEWQADLIGDPVILRADGRALYNFATVIDDVDLKITHVIRAEEHLTNTAVQVVAYEALGMPVPKFAHVPVVNEPKSKKKLSKRDMKKFVTPEIKDKLRNIGWTDEQIEARDDLNPATVAFYKELGYLPSAIVNYLGRLGWSLDDKTEFIPLDQMVTNFGLERVKDSPASFDPDKLYWLAGEHMKLLSLEEKVTGVLPFLVRAQLLTEPVDETTKAKIRRIVEACGERIKLFSDILTYGAFFFRKDPVYDKDALKKRVQKEGTPDLLRKAAAMLKTVEAFDHDTLEKAVQGFCEQHQVKLADINHALRVSTTGVPVGPGLFDCLAILGKEETLRRIDLALAQEKVA